MSPWCCVLREDQDEDVDGLNKSLCHEPLPHTKAGGAISVEGQLLRDDVFADEECRCKAENEGVRRRHRKEFVRRVCREHHAY